MYGTEYATITDALAAIPTSGTTATYTIVLGKGTYAENGLSYNGTATIKIVGDTTTKYGADVVIKGRGNKMDQERGRELLEIQGTGNIILENLTLESDYLRSEVTGDVQAEVLGTDTKGYTAAYNCAFKSHQDTLRTTGKAWFYGCYIEGDTDFIWMEQGGQVALYEKCEIVSVYDQYAGTHASYITAPRMTITDKIGKGLVIFNSTVREQNAAQATYLARTPWSSGYYNQVAYINTTCEGIESSVWYKSQIATEFAKTVVGWKMDQATADSIGYAGNDDIVDATTVANEFSGRKTILNRVYNAGKQKYEKDTASNWDIDSVITDNGWVVDTDTSSDVLAGETVGEVTTYKFDGSEDQSALCNGFAQEGTKAQYRGANGNTITIPVSGKCYVEVYGYYQGTMEAKAGSQGESVMFFNNGTTNSELCNTYAVYDENATSVVLTAMGTTYITKVVVTTDSTIENKEVTSIDISGSTTNYTVGVALTLSASITPTDATNKSVKWSSSNTDLATIDVYTGKVSFKAAGEVTFTCSACDGSGTEATFTCEAKAANWKIAEWYTTDSKLDSTAETTATGIGNFDAVGEYKSLGATYKFTNIKGNEISTANGLKLNGSGKLTIATTKAGATLTIIVCKANKDFGIPKVACGSTTLTPISTTKDDEENTTMITYVYRLETAGAWEITRPANTEINPILYACCKYDDPVISTNTSLLFGKTDGNYESEVAEYFNITATIEDNGGNDSKIYGGVIEFTVEAGASVEVYANWGENYTINDEDGQIIEHVGTGVGNAGKRTYTYSKKTKITITCDAAKTGKNYFYWIKVTF